MQPLWKPNSPLMKPSSSFQSNSIKSEHTYCQHKMRTHKGKHTETIHTSQMHTNALYFVWQWKKALDLFCEDEFSVKTRHYHCCKLQAQARLNCFETEAPNPSYGPTTQYSGPELLPRGPGFIFTNNCPRSENQREGKGGGGECWHGEVTKCSRQNYSC